MHHPLVALPLLALLPAVGLADETSAELGETYGGTLSALDDTYGDGSYVDYYDLTVQPGQRVVITMRSGSFDSWLQLHLPPEEGGVKYNDDMGEGTLDAQIEHVFERAGTYRVGATSNGAGSVGAYSIEFAGDGAAPVSAGPIVLDGTLADGDRTLGESGEYYDHYVLDCAAGDTIRIYTESPVDTYLIVEAPGTGQLDDDDSGEGLNAELTLTPASSGDLEIVITTASAGQTGAYRLVVEGARQRGGGHRFAGELAAGDETLSSGEYIDSYEFLCARGDELEITMQSTELDAYLILVPPAGDNVENDDSEEGSGWLHSRLRHTCGSTGTYTIIATSAQAAETGAYSILVHGSSSAPTTDAPAAPLAAPASSGSSAGETYSGRLESGDETYDDGCYVDFYSVDVTAGQTVTATLSSTDFDSWLQLEMPEEEGGSIYNDDLSTSTLDARIVHTFTRAGTYRFGATSRAAGTSGDYTLTIQSGAMAAPTSTSSGTEVRSGVLEDGDRTLGEGGEYYDHYVLHCAPGDQVRIYTASSVDTYLIVKAPGLEAQLDDDDSGEGLNALVEFTSAGSGDLEVLVTTASPGQSGEYDLIVEGATPYVGGRDYSGTLSPGDQNLDSGEYTDLYTFYAEAGEVVELTLQSAEFDPYLMLRPPVGEQIDNDDAEGKTAWHHSRITHTCATAGEYEVLATSFAPAEVGEYTLWIRRPQGEGTQLVSGSQRLNGELVSGAATRPQGQYLMPYSFEGQAGQEVRIEMRSNAIDPYLVLVPPVGESIENDDISSTDTNARIETTLATSGTYRLQASSFAGGQTGSFTLEAEGLSSRLVADSSSAVSTSRNYWAIVCGITDYGGAGDLPNCRRDAERLAGGLVYDGVLSPSNLILLTDSEGTAEGIRNAFAQLAPKVQPGDIFLFFYSGHGTRGDNDPRATDEPDRRDEFLALHEGSISDDEMQQLFSTIPAKLSMLVLDSCFSGGFARDVISEPGRLGIFSSEEDVVSLVASEFNAGGYLAHYFRRGMRGEADNDQDGTVTVGELDWFLRSEFNKLEIETETDEGALGYQRLVIERGGVQVTEPLVHLHD